MTLDAERSARYARQLVIPAIGTDGQERLAAARVRVVGASGPFAPALVYLALAGVGTLWIDDPEAVGAGDVGHWLYPPPCLGEPRGRIAAAALAERSRFIRVLDATPEQEPTGLIVLAPSPAKAVSAAELGRKARLPLVVAELDGDGGSVVTVPVGAPCFACARSVTGARRPPEAGASAVAALAAEELILLLARPERAAGRRCDITRGVPSTRPTARLAGCACGGDIVR